MSLALDAAGARRLGLKDRIIALLEVPALSFQCVLVCVEGDKTRFEYFHRLERLRPPLAYGKQQWAHCQLDPDPAAASTFCLRRSATTRVPTKQQNVWHPATLRVVEAQALEQKAAAGR
jgi:hypothetical protein